MDPTNTNWILTAATAIAIVGGAVALIWKGIRWVLSTLRKVSEFLEDWRGEDARPGHARQPGVPERFTNLEERLMKVEQEINRISVKIDNP